MHRNIKPKVCLVVLNFNTWDSAVRCVRTATTGGLYSSLINSVVVDNNSPQKITTEQKKELNELGATVIFCSRNGGYSAGNNVGFEHAIRIQAENILIVNPDVEISGESILQLANEVSRNRTVGVGAPKVLLESGEDQPIILGKEPTLSLKYRLLICKLTKGMVFGREWADNELQSKKQEETTSPYMVSGCCFLVPEEHYFRLFPLDERVFLYLEEHIIGKKLQRHMLSATIYNSISCRHVHGESTKAIGTRRLASLTFSEVVFYVDYCKNRYLHLVPLIVYRLLTIILSRPLTHENLKIAVLTVGKIRKFINNRSLSYQNQ